MAKFIIEGGQPLRGEVQVLGNKNATLPILAAMVLATEPCEIDNVPKIADVQVMSEILIDLGAKVERVGDHRLNIDPRGIKDKPLNSDLVRRLRASVLFLGPLLARFGKATMRHPGGCVIGRRAVGTHFEALGALGAKTMVGDENYQSEVKNPRPANIFLDEASVTATENAMMMAVLISGTTIIEGAASEPHVEDLAQFLNKIGADVRGAGTNRIEVRGVKKLAGIHHRIRPDHIEAGTFIMAAAVTGGAVRIKGVRMEDLRMTLLYLQRMGVKTEVEGDVLKVLPSKLKAPDKKVQSRPWPGFPTDLMSPLIVLATQAEGTTLCHDWMYEGRMFFVDKLISMGAKITACDPHRVLVSGPTKLRGRQLESPDIRAGVALVLAALCAKGKSEIGNIELVERGYEEIEKRLSQLGARIKREEVC